MLEVHPELDDLLPQRGGRRGGRHVTLLSRFDEVCRRTQPVVSTNLTKPPIGLERHERYIADLLYCSQRQQDTSALKQTIFSMHEELHDAQYPQI